MALKASCAIKLPLGLGFSDIKVHSGAVINFHRDGLVNIFLRDEHFYNGFLLSRSS
jgi:hypothetical protein